MTVLADWRAAGDEPGLHALIIGIGHYPHLPAAGQPGRPEQFGLTSVDGPAVSAFRLARFLQNLPPGAELVAPLKSLRVALAPTEADKVTEPGLSGWAGPTPTLEVLRDLAKAWRKDCEASDKEVALFSFSGHGVRHDGGDCLVLADFGKGADPSSISLNECVVREEVLEGMCGPARDDSMMARVQFWFVDACRNFVGRDYPGEVGEPSKLLTPRNPDGRSLIAGGVASTAAATNAFAGDAEGGTAFGAALLTSLKGALGDTTPWPPEAPSDVDPWPVTTSTIRQAVARQLGRNSLTQDQRPENLGNNQDYPLLLFKVPPTVKLWVRVGPPLQPSSVTSLELYDPVSDVSKRRDLCPLDPHPLQFSCAAGRYLAEIRTTDGGLRRKAFFASLIANEWRL